MTELEKHVEAMITKAAQSEKSEDALRFSQGALNAANALAVLRPKADRDRSQASPAPVNWVLGKRPVFRIGGDVERPVKSGGSPA